MIQNLPCLRKLSMQQAVFSEYDLRGSFGLGLGKLFVPQSPLRSIYGIALMLVGPDIDVIAGVLSMFSNMTALAIGIIDPYYSATPWADPGHPLANIDHIRPQMIRLSASASS